MPHLRTRHAFHLIQKLKSHSPIIGILGHRQVGKTTLLEQLSQRYYSLDNRKELLEARKDPDGYIESRSQGWVALDECQNVPELFPALKEQVRKVKGRPGQFLLSGSVRFSGNPRIRESLTGRITNLELLPLSIAEIEGAEPVHVFSDLLELDSFQQHKMEQSFFQEKREQKRKERALSLYLEQGGLPGICFIREPKIRFERIRSSLETILDRDLRQIVRTNLPYQMILALLKSLASKMDVPLDFSSLGRETDISRPTLRKLIYALENVFVLRLIKLEGARRGFGYFFEDIAESNFLSEGPLSLDFGLAHALWMNARVSLLYRMGYMHEFFRFHSRSGQMSFCIRKESSVLGVLCIQEDHPNRKELGVSDSFLKTYRNSKVCLVHREASLRVIDERQVLMPANCFI
jgi:hypothetical protein